MNYDWLEEPLILDFATLNNNNSNNNNNNNNNISILLGTYIHTKPTPEDILKISSQFQNHRLKTPQQPTMYIISSLDQTTSMIFNKIKNQKESSVEYPVSCFSLANNGLERVVLQRIRTEAKEAGKRIVDWNMGADGKLFY